MKNPLELLIVLTALCLLAYVAYFMGSVIYTMPARM